MPSYPTISRSELAGRLGIPEADILTREEAASLIGIKPSYLSNLRNLGPGFYRSSKSLRGGVAWYPRKNVESYAKYRKTDSKRAFPGGMGELEWPPMKDNSPVGMPVHRIVEMVYAWKEAELYRRAQRYSDGVDISGPDYEEYKRERKVILPANHPLSFAEDHVFNELTMKAKSIWGPLDPPPLAVELLRSAWREVIVAEDEWQMGELSSLPTRAPK